MRRAAPLAACLALLSAGCHDAQQSAPPARPQLETVEVAPPPDALVDPSADVQERRRAESFSGVLPGGFPAGLPLPAGASLVDQGERWVEVLVGRTPAEVRPAYLARLRQAGWEVSEEGSALRLRRGAVSVRGRLSAQGPSTRLRLEY